MYKYSVNKPNNFLITSLYKPVCQDIDNKIEYVYSQTIFNAP